jgi:hypothetical protein
MTSCAPIDEIKQDMESTRPWTDSYAEMSDSEKPSGCAAAFKCVTIPAMCGSGSYNHFGVAAFSNLCRKG